MEQVQHVVMLIALDVTRQLLRGMQSQLTLDHEIRDREAA